MENGGQVFVPLRTRHFFLRIQSRMRETVNFRDSNGLSFRRATFEREIVRDAEEPATQIVAGFVLQEMRKQRKEDFLDNFFGIVLV